MQRTALFVALLMTATVVSAQAYKWTDAKGTVHYSQSPPPKGVKYNQITLTGSAQPLSAPASPGPASDTEEAGSEAPSRAPVADTPENRAKMCASLQSNIDALKGSGPVVMEQGGQQRALNAAQRKQQFDSAQAQYQQYCQGQ